MVQAPRMRPRSTAAQIGATARGLSCAVRRLLLALSFVMAIVGGRATIETDAEQIAERTADGEAENLREGVRGTHRSEARRSGYAVHRFRADRAPRRLDPTSARAVVDKRRGAARRTAPPGDDDDDDTTDC